MIQKKQVRLCRKCLRLALSNSTMCSVHSFLETRLALVKRNKPQHNYLIRKEY